VAAQQMTMGRVAKLDYNIGTSSVARSQHTYERTNFDAQ
jgi:hypothetical protein